MMLPLTQELLLIALDEESGRRHKTETIDYGLAGAAVAELALLRRVDLSDGRVKVVDPTPTGDVVLDELLSEAAAKTRKVKTFVAKFYRKMSRKVGEQLAAAGIVTEETKHFLGFIPSRRFPETNPRPEIEIRRRLNAAILQRMPTDERTATLVALIEATELRKQAFPGVPRGEIKSLMKEFAKSDPSSEAVRKAIADVRGAVAAAAAASGAAAASS